MSLYKPKGSPYWHYDFQFKGRRFYGSTGCTSKTDARQFEAMKRREAALPEAKPSISLDDAAGLYWTNVTQHQASASTTEYILAFWVEALGRSKLLREITTADIARVAATRRASISDSSVNRELEVIRALWRYAERVLRRDVGEMPLWTSLFYARSSERVREMTPDEEKRYFKAMRPDLVDFFRFAMKRGIRRSGILGLRWSDLDLQRGLITYTLKRRQGEAPRRVSKRLTPDEVALLARQPRVGPYVFTYVCGKTQARGPKAKVARIKGERYPLTPTVLRQAHAKACSAAGIEDFRIHDHRHTAATRLLRTSRNLRHAQLLLDHTNIKTTVKYAHATEDEVYDAMMAMERGEAESRNTPEIPEAHGKNIA